MMTSILLVDVQGLETRVGNGLSPSELLSELSNTMHGMQRQIMVQRAYCSARISTYRRNAYRDAGYQIIETAGPDETLIMMTLDLADLSGGAAVYEEAILLGGTTDYTALARLAHENLMQVSLMDHPTIPNSLEALADKLIDPEELPVSDTPSILDRGESKREETNRPSPFLAPPPKDSILSPVAEPKEVEAADEPESETEKTGTIADAPTASELKDAAVDEADADTSITDTDPLEEAPKDTKAGDPWPDPKTGPILVAGGSIAEAVGLATALDDPEKPEDEADTPAIPSDAADTLEAELAEDVNAELSISAEDIGKDQEETPATVSIDLQIEDLVAEEFTDTSETGSELATTDITKADADDAADKDDDALDALFADLGSDLAPDTSDASAEAAPADPLDSLDINPDELLEDLDPLEPETTAASAETKDDQTDDLAASDKVEKTSSKELSEEVDELLSRLMADGPSDEAAKKEQLDVVPER